MPTQQVPSSNPGTDVKYTTLIVLMLIGVVVSSIGLALQLSEKQGTTNDVTTNVGELNDKSPAAPTVEEPKFANLLEKKPYYSLPFGAAEVEAYYTKTEKATTLNDSGPTVTCSALTLVDGPKILMSSLEEAGFGTPPTIVIGSEDSHWTGVNESTRENPAKLLVTLGSMFEGEAIGCMSVVFDTFTVIE